MRRRRLHGRMFGFGAADNGVRPLLTGQSSHAVATESVWQCGIRMLGSFGGQNRSHCAPPVMSINPDGTLAVVFQQGGRSMLQMARETMYDRCPPFTSTCSQWRSVAKQFPLYLSRPKYSYTSMVCCNLFQQELPLALPLHLHSHVQNTLEAQTVDVCPAGQRCRTLFISPARARSRM